MYSCSICGETFLGVHLDSAYSTLCGHVFHQKCLTTWLNRSSTCPHCRAKVLKTDPIKLYLQLELNSQVTGERTIEEQLNLFKTNCDILKVKNDHNNCLIFKYETQINQLMNTVQENKITINSLKLESDRYKRLMNDIRDQLRALNIENQLIRDQKLNVESQLLSEQSKNKILDKNVYELQSVNARIIDQLKFEIADLKTEKLYYQNRCQNLEENKPDSPSTSKIKNENKNDNIILPDVQAKSKYQGHDPHLKLSSKRFLVGCIFLFVEDQNRYEDICNNISMSKLNIIEHGGTIEQSYSPRVTHIICTTQKNTLIQQAIKDGKRCVTDYWLSDVITQQKMLPPWLAHHFPTPYSEESGKPCQQFQIAIANFDLNEFYRIKAMIELTGAQVVTEISSQTDAVISLRLDGELVKIAQNLGKPVVNVQWLNDILFGAHFGIKYPTSVIYQQFNLKDPFSINYEMVLHLMEAWKTPVLFLKSQEVYDLTDSSASHLKRKRQKSVIQNPELIDLTEQEDMSCGDVIITNIITKNKPCVLFSGFTTTKEKELQQIVERLGGIIAVQSKEATHLIMKEPTKTLKFLCCLSTVDYIINEDWLIESNLFSKFQDEKKYCIKNIDIEFNMVCNVPDVLTSSTRQQLFKDLIFFVTPGISDPPILRLKEIILSAGGTIEKERRSFTSIQQFKPNTYFLISCLEDVHLIDDLLKINYVVYSSGFVINSIVKQSIDVKSDTLFSPR